MANVDEAAASKNHTEISSSEMQDVMRFIKARNDLTAVRKRQNAETRATREATKEMEWAILDIMVNRGLGTLTVPDQSVQLVCGVKTVEKTVHATSIQTMLGAPLEQDCGVNADAFELAWKTHVVPLLPQPKQTRTLRVRQVRKKAKKNSKKRPEPCSPTANSDIDDNNYNYNTLTSVAAQQDDKTLVLPIVTEESGGERSKRRRKLRRKEPSITSDDKDLFLGTGDNNKQTPDIEQSKQDDDKEQQPITTTTGLNAVADDANISKSSPRQNRLLPIPPPLFF